MAKFVGYTGKVLPDDVTAKLKELAECETQPLAKEIYKTMFENQRLAKQLDRPSRQDTGVTSFLCVAAQIFRSSESLKSYCERRCCKLLVKPHFVTTASKHLMSTIPAKMSARARRVCFGISCQIVASARYTPIWQVVAAACLAKRLC